MSNVRLPSTVEYCCGLVVNVATWDCATIVADGEFLHMQGNILTNKPTWLCVRVCGICTCNALYCGKELGPIVGIFAIV